MRLLEESLGVHIANVAGRASNQDKPLDHWSRFYRRKTHAEHQRIIAEERRYAEMSCEELIYLEALGRHYEELADEYHDGCSDY